MEGGHVAVSGAEPYRILIAEDNPADIHLYQYLFSESEVPIVLDFAHDGMEASDYLFHRHRFAQVPLPDLILMDLHLPKKSGKELLREVKGDSHLRKVPLIVLSNSSHGGVKEECYALGASAFVSKPVDIAKSQELIRSLVSFWLRCVELPLR